MTSAQGEFFLVVAPGLESLAAQELCEKWPVLAGALAPPPQVTVVEGGLLLAETPWPWGWALNHLLKIPTRILQRVASFKCRDFPKLFNKVKKFDWSPFLAGAEPTIDASCHRSRLMHKGRLAETVADGITAYYQRQPPRRGASPSPVPGLFVRLSDDLCTLSIDTSGEALYKRWPGKIVGRAPLRETLAAALCRELARHFDPQWQKVLVVDPLCGSGTIPAEVVSHYALSARSEYAYQAFPCVRKGVAPISALMPPPRPGPELRAWGFDRDEAMVAHARENFAALGIPFAVHDALQAMPAELYGQAHAYDALCLLSNPPYGQRLKAGPGGLTEALAKLLGAAQQHWQPTLHAVLLPESVAPQQLAQALRAPLLGQQALRNGGLRVRFMLFGQAR